MQWKVKIETKLKESILDPQGQAVASGLEALGYKNVSEIHVGKYLEMFIEATDEESKVTEQVNQMCERLLANPVIEDYTFQLEKVEG